MALTIDDVKKIATLARLRFNSDEENVLTGQLAKVLEYIDQLQQVDISPGGSAAAGAAPEAEDCTVPCLDHAMFLANAPASLGDFLVVPEVKAGGGGDELA